MKSICFFMPTSNLIIEKPQITLDLVAKDVEKVVFQKMRKSFKSGQVRCLIFTFNVSSKVRVYENLKNVFQEVMGKQSFSNQTRYQPSDIVENQAKITLDLSLKNVKNAFFESMISHQNANGVTSLTFTFTTLSIDPIYEEPVDPIYEELENHSQRENTVPEKNTPPSAPPVETIPTRRAVSNSLYGLVKSKEKNPLKKIIRFFDRTFAKRSSSIPQTQSPIASDNGFACTGIKRNACKEEPIYESIKERKSSEDSGYETPISSPRESIKSIFSDSSYEVPRQVEPAIYLEVLP